jgi:hypothetical protein
MPQDHTPEEVRGFSDIVHACHAAMGSQVSCNEEWYYSPRDATDNIPWHILIRWRTHNPAGFEGGTRIYINPISPEELRDKLVPRLFDLKNKKKIAPCLIAFECPCQPNSLRYVYGRKDHTWYGSSTLSSAQHARTVRTPPNEVEEPD